MSEQPSPLSTGAMLGQYYKDLIASGIPPEVAEKAVLIAAEGLTRAGDINVSAKWVTA